MPQPRGTVVLPSGRNGRLMKAMHCFATARLKRQVHLGKVVSCLVHEQFVGKEATFSLSECGAAIQALQDGSVKGLAPI
jgi:hypothetical protein